MVLGHDISKGKRTQDVRISDDVSFDTMLLRNATFQGLKKAGFFRPSPIQLHGIPLGKCGFDLLLEAKSGTGKTAVFAVIALEKLNLNNGLQTIILAPTREIASQISSVITDIGSQYEGLNIAVVIGGLPIKADIEKFKENVHIVVGSPGRLRHLIQSNHINISSVRLIVLDEADKLMENSFQPDINYIFSLLPKQKQVIMSSATYSEETKLFISKYVKKAQHICPDSNSILLGIEQKVTVVPFNSNIVKQTRNRYEELKKILNEKQFKQCLIFCNYQVRVGELYRMLSRDKWPAQQLYGSQEQTDRLDALKTLQEYKCRILVSTDLAARGIDASNVDVVINFEPPIEWQTYLHRIGRAGRYGSYGIAITILCEGKEKAKFKDVLGQTNIPFHIQGLWDDEMFNLSENPINDTTGKNEPPIDSSLKITSNNNDETQELLWKALTIEPEKNNNKEGICSFDTLCDSFKKTTVASFSDLIDSFIKERDQICKSTVCSEYKHMKVDQLPIKSFEFWQNVQDKSPCSEKDFQNNHVPENIIELNGADQKLYRNSLNDKESPQTDKEKELTECLKKESSELLIPNCDSEVIKENIQVNNFQISTNKANVHENISLESNKYEEIEIDAAKQALLDAGLPVAFGKPEIKNNRRYHKSNSQKKSENINLKASIVEKLNLPESIKTDPNEKEIKKIHSNKTFTKKHYSSNTDESYQSYSSGETKDVMNPVSKIRNSCLSTATISNNNDQTDSKSCVQKRMKQFDLWYSQLKHQIQFLQYNLYIEELGKL